MHYTGFERVDRNLNLEMDSLKRVELLLVVRVRKAWECRVLELLLRIYSDQVIPLLLNVLEDTSNVRKLSNKCVC